MFTYVTIGLTIFIKIAYGYAILYEGYNVRAFEFIGVNVLSVIICYCLKKIVITPIKWQFLYAVKKGYPHLVKQFNFLKEDINDG